MKGTVEWEKNVAQKPKKRHWSNRVRARAKCFARKSTARFRLKTAAALMAAARAADEHRAEISARPPKRRESPPTAWRTFSIYKVYSRIFFQTSSLPNFVLAEQGII